MSRFAILSVLTVGLLTPVTAAEAQPSDRQIQQNLRRAFPDALEVRLRPDAAGTRQLSPGSWEHQRMVEVVTPATAFAPEFPNAKAVSYGGAIFTSSNNRSWTYSRMTVGETTYEGVPTPSQEALLTIFRAHRFEDFFQWEENLVGMPELTLREENACRWYSTTRIECTFVTTVDMKRGRSIARMPRTVNVTLWRNEGADAWHRYSTTWSDDPSRGRPERINPTPEALANLTMLPTLLAALPAPATE
ncbi:MAG: hypothetical protein JRH11_06150 [Deltaproteobacteria bacterium]|nr:hypothetical protein [Deltaproteobacteria bacterium]